MPKRTKGENHLPWTSHFAVTPRMWLAFWAVSAHCLVILNFSFKKTHPSQVFLPRASFDPFFAQPVLALGIAGTCTWPGWTSRGPYTLTSQAYIGPSGCHPFLPTCWWHHRAVCHQQMCWVCTQSHCPCHQNVKQLPFAVRKGLKLEEWRGGW